MNEPTDPNFALLISIAFAVLMLMAAFRCGVAYGREETDKKWIAAADVNGVVEIGKKTYEAIELLTVPRIVRDDLESRDGLDTDWIRRRGA